jgi:hypothetical protein
MDMDDTVYDGEAADAKQIFVPQMPRSKDYFLHPLWG